MTSLLDAAGYVVAPPADDAALGVVVAFVGPFDGRSAAWLGTSDHGGIASGFDVRFLQPTSSPASAMSSEYFRSEEVSRLRDQIIDAVGMTRQEIASALGVDRRSLSGFASGEIRPSPARLDSLRLLAKVALHAAARWGERARDVLLSANDGRSLLDRLGSGEVSTFAWLDSITTATVRPEFERRATRARPLYEVVRGGATPARSRVVRDPSTWGQDLSESHAFEEQALPVRRPRMP